MSCRGFLPFAAIFSFASLLAGKAHAQNIITNPYFDDDLTGWEVEPLGLVTTSNTMDYHVAESVRHVSMQIDVHGGTPSIGVQCVDAFQPNTYVATVWVFSLCPGQRFHVFWTDATCTAGDSFVSAQSTKTNQWEQLLLVAQAPPDTQKAIVVLENAGGPCTDTAYFDDVVFQPDAIFADDFERKLPPRFGNNAQDSK